MAGLIRKKDDNKVSGNDASQGPTEEASPEEQASYETFIDNGLKLIHDESSMQAILNMVGSGIPVEGLSNALMSVLTRLRDTAEAQGVELPLEFILQGGSELMAEIADLAEEAGIHDFEEEEIEASFALASQIFLMNSDEKAKGGQEQSLAPQQASQGNAGGRSGLLPPGGAAPVGGA